MPLVAVGIEDIVHSDILIFETPTHQGGRYVITFEDDASRDPTIIFLL